MKTEDVVALINAHYEGDEAAFKRIASKIAVHEAINEHPKTAREITYAISGEHAAKEAETKQICAAYFTEGKTASAVYPDGEIVRVRIKNVSFAGVTLENEDVYEERLGRGDCLILNTDPDISSESHRLFLTLTQARKEQKKCRLLEMIREKVDETEDCSRLSVPQLKRIVKALGIDEGMHVN